MTQLSGWPLLEFSWAAAMELSSLLEVAEELCVFETLRFSFWVSLLLSPPLLLPPPPQIIDRSGRPAFEVEFKGKNQVFTPVEVASSILKDLLKLGKVEFGHF